MEIGSRDRAESPGPGRPAGRGDQEDPAMAVRPKTPSGLAVPAEPVPVAMLGRTSTLELQDPYGSITRQITTAREWLPDGFYLAGYYWDIESGGLDLEAARPRRQLPAVRGQGPAPRRGPGRPARRSPLPVPPVRRRVCEDIERVRPGHVQRAEAGTRTR